MGSFSRVEARRLECAARFERGGKAMPPYCSSLERLLEAVRAAGRLRETLFGPFGREADTNAYRLSNGEGDGTPGFLVDAYAGFLVVQVLNEGVLEQSP